MHRFVKPNSLCSNCDRKPKKVSASRYDCPLIGEYVDAPTHCLYYSGASFPVDLVVITSTSVEHEAVWRFLHPAGEVAWHNIDGFEYIDWQFCEIVSGAKNGPVFRIATARTRQMGLSSASALTATALQLFRPTTIAMVGIAAGRRGKINVGDVVVPVSIWDHDAGKWSEKGGRATFQPSGDPHQFHGLLQVQCRKIKEDRSFFSNLAVEWEAESGKFPPLTPTVETEFPMVSGAAVIDTEIVWHKILKRHRKIVAIDMEAFGVAHSSNVACVSKYTPNCIVAKSTCDFGEKKDDSGQGYAAFTSVRFLRRYIELFCLGEEALKSADRRNYPRSSDPDVSIAAM